MVTLYRKVIHAFVRLLVFCALECAVFARQILAKFEPAVDFTVKLVIAVARAVPALAVSTKRSHDEIKQLAGYGHVAMLKGLGA